MHTKIYDSTESIFDFPVGYETESGVFETPPFFGGNDTPFLGAPPKFGV